MASINFDASTVAPSAPREVIPPGKYLGQIVNSEMRATKDGNGQFLWLEVELLDGEFAGRRVFDRLNLVNGNATAVEIAQRALSSICYAVGQMQVKDSEQLHFKPLVVTVKVRPPRGEYEASNEVSGYAPQVGTTPNTPARPMTAPMQHSVRPAAPAGAVSTPPWKRAASA